MAGERRLKILDRLVGPGTPGLETKRLCDVCAEVTGMSGAGIMLMSGDVPRGSVCTTNEVSALIEELQFDARRGALRRRLPPRSAGPRTRSGRSPTPRWLAFSGPAIHAGARAVFGFPLQVGAVSIGSLDLYRDRPGPLTDDQHADALVMADIAAHAVLMLQANAPPGQLAVELEARADFEYVVHQASGMVAAQLEVSVGQALIRLRAYAFGNDRPLAEVAREVVARTLRFDAKAARTTLVRDRYPSASAHTTATAGGYHGGASPSPGPAHGRARGDWRSDAQRSAARPDTSWSWPTRWSTTSTSWSC